MNAGGGHIETIAAASLLPPKQLLTVHYVPCNMLAEFGHNLPSMLTNYYTRQSNASVLIYAPFEEILDVVKNLTAVDVASLPYTYTLTVPAADERGREGVPMFGPVLRWTHMLGVEFLFVGARIEPPADFRKSTVAYCASRTWTQQYVLHAGVQAAYHMLRLPPLGQYEFVIKMDLDMEFLQPMDDLSARLGPCGRDARRQVLHAGGGTPTHIAKPDQCERGVGQSLEAYAKRRGWAAGSEPPAWCHEPLSYIFFTYFVGFRSSFLLSPQTQALSAFFYNDAWPVFFQSRAQEQGVYSALVCYSIPGMPDLESLHGEATLRAHSILDLSHLKGTVFLHGKKHRASKELQSNQPLAHSVRHYADPWNGVHCRVRLQRQTSRTACVFNETFGCSSGHHEHGRIWVDGGCRGLFAVGSERNERVIPCGFPTGPTGQECPRANALPFYLRLPGERIRR